jgi:hypothetical protein
MSPSGNIFSLMSDVNRNTSERNIIAVQDRTLFMYAIKKMDCVMNCHSINLRFNITPEKEIHIFGDPGAYSTAPLASSPAFRKLFTQPVLNRCNILFPFHVLSDFMGILYYCDIGS